MMETLLPLMWELRLPQFIHLPFKLRQRIMISLKYLDPSLFLFDLLLDPRLTCGKILPSPR